MCTGELNARDGNTRLTASVAAGSAPATQLVLPGRVSRPETGGCGTSGVVTCAAADSADSFAGVAASNARTR